MIKVRIDKSNENTWYAKEFIGEELYVTEDGDSFWGFSKNKTIWKSDCTILSDDSQEEAKPVLIAKAGEWAKIVDFGEAHR